MARTIINTLYDNVDGQYNRSFACFFFKDNRSQSLFSFWGTLILYVLIFQLIIWTSIKFKEQVT